MTPQSDRLFTENRSSRTLTPVEFADVKRKAALRSKTRRRIGEDAGYATDLPQELSLQLTYACNLRCTHCYQWNEQGFFREFGIEKVRNELDLAILERLLRETAELKPKTFLWGGEPLMYRRLPELTELLERYPRKVNICTNGLLIKRNLPHLLRLGDNLNLTVSLDGLGADHEALRGPRSFDRTVDNIRAVLDLRRSGEYKGELTVNCMVSNETVGKLYEFMEWAEDLGVHSVYFQLPWFISPEVAAQMDEVYARDFAWLGTPPAPGTATWHSYTYHIAPENVPVLHESMRRLAERVWRVWIRYQPEVTLGDVTDFVIGRTSPVAQRSKCLAVSNRLEVHADGKVSSCKFFPEFVVGEMGEGSVADVWHGETFRRVRSVLRSTGLMPVCSKCFLLYENGV
ncbi:radical SAM/SPASM domain-containing protein [Sphaerisporangium aureirubrum]|uniref:Radical SAM/SPASM domain-containing protein n=1 Tax=Sphaerisporangium aureirubrum TaxID=1544736 RepID=A0ABW1N9K7_9ACTN